MENYVHEILLIIQQNENYLDSQHSLEEVENIARSMIHLSYILVEKLEEIQEKYQQREITQTTQNNELSKELDLTLKEFERQRENFENFQDSYKQLEEKLNKNAVSSTLQIQSLEQQLKESQLQFVSLQLQCEEVINHYQEQLYQKELTIIDINSKLESLRFNSFSLFDTTKSALPNQGEQTQKSQLLKDNTSGSNIEKEKKSLSVVSLQYLDVLQNKSEDGKEINGQTEQKNNEEFFNNLPESASQVSLQAVKRESYLEKILRTPKLDPTNQEQFNFKFAAPFLKSQFASKLHTRHNSIGLNFQLDNDKLWVFNSDNQKGINQQTERNIYEDFFHLISQCVKLDLQVNQYYPIHVDHLYQSFIEQKIPFNKWYGKIKEYLLEQNLNVK